MAVRKLALFYAILAAAGLVLSAWLWYHATRTAVLFCPSGGGCSTVQQSRYAHFLGLPVAAWGAFYYLLAVFVAAQWAIARPVPGQERMFSWLVLVLAATGEAVSLYLIYLELFIIRAVCFWCVVSATITTLLLVTAVVARLTAARRPS